ncbi:unnamed protein product [Paramecium sonneborni]|uniref:Uncharacterized protein n=1 Tax=Paramecium sonneborni TaxID=65129 RepID=A0A8S1RSG7_9CILI|nr:unnamed protein product [Paramecium sonneborni]
MLLNIQLSQKQSFKFKLELKNNKLISCSSENKLIQFFYFIKQNEESIIFLQIEINQRSKRLYFIIDQTFIIQSQGEQVISIYQQQQVDNYFKKAEKVLLHHVVIKVQIKYLLQQEIYKLQQQIEFLKKDKIQDQQDIAQLNYYLRAMPLISTNLIQINSNSVIESKSEKVLNYVKQSVKWFGIISDPISVVGYIFSISNEVLDSLVEGQDDKVKQQSLQLHQQSQRQKYNLQFEAFSLIKKLKLQY